MIKNIYGERTISRNRITYTTKSHFRRSIISKCRHFCKKTQTCTAERSWETKENDPICSQKRQDWFHGGCYRNFRDADSVDVILESGRKMKLSKLLKIIEVLRCSPSSSVGYTKEFHELCTM